MCRKLFYLISFVLMLGLVLTSVAEAADPDLVGWWKLDETSGTTANDATGNGNHGTLFNGPQWVSGVFAGALHLDGSDDYVAIQNLNYATTGHPEVTVCAWIRTSDSGDQIIASYDRNEYWRLEINGNGAGAGQVGWDVLTSTGQVDYGSSTRVDDGQWHHVAGVFDNGTLIIYIDGSPEPSVSGGPTFGSGNTRYGFIGVGSEASSFDGNKGPTNYFNGDMDDVRIYSRALTQDEIEDVMKGDLIIATNPNPADGATDVCPKVVLSWTPGPFVGALSPKHKVFLSENFDDVNDGVGGVTQDPNRYPAAGTLSLDLGKTYYWKVDEANSTTGWDEGGIWQFTIEPTAYPIAGDKITATTSSSNNASEGPENTINGSGLDANDMHSTVQTDMWRSGDEPNGAWIEYELDKVYTLHEMWVWNHNTVYEGDLGYGLKDVTIEYSENGADYMTLGTTHEFARAPGAPGYEHNTEVYFGVPAKYVKLTSNSNWGGIFDQYGLSEVRFFRIPVRAGEESPESGTTIDGIDVVLSWRPGREADEHNVYFSTSFEDVNTGTIAPDIIPAADGCRASYGPLSLDLGKTYYWKVNEVNLAEEPNTWQGDVWNFTTPEYLLVDDMEAYTGRQSIRAVWHDGYVATATSGSNVTVSTESDDRDPRLAGVGPPWPVRGSEAMQFAYDNDGSITLYVPGYAEYTYSANANYYSEIEASTSGPNSLEVGRNWASAEALSLWFYGDPNNDAEEMYVKLNGSKVVYDGDAGDVQQAGWHEWNIALSDFGVDLQNVTMVYIGFGDENNTTTPGGSGVVYFDDIRLYPTRCVLSLRSDDFARVDYVRDCVIDYKEVAVMAANWLAVAAAPGTVPNGDFEEIYKPGSVAITGVVSPGGWSQGVGPECPIENGSYEFDDATTGDVADIPGWLGYDRQGWIDFGGYGDRDQTTGNLQGSISSQGNHTPGGMHQYLANGGDWGPNPAGGLIVSDAPLGNVEDGTYTLSMFANGGAAPVVLDLLAGGTALTPTSSVDPNLSDPNLSGWQEFSRTYGSASLVGHIGQPLTIVLGVGRPLPDGATGTQTRFDDVTLFHSPEPLPTEILRLAGRRVDLYEDKKIDFKDFAELAAWWLDEVLWP